MSVKAAGGLPRSSIRRLRSSEALIGAASEGGDVLRCVPFLPPFTHTVAKQTVAKQTNDTCAYRQSPCLADTSLHVSTTDNFDSKVLLKLPSPMATVYFGLAWK